MRRTAFVLFMSVTLLSTAAMAGDEVAPAGRTELSGTKADVPRLISYQGTLTDPSGVALDTTVTMIFSIYIEAASDDPLWAEEHPAVTVDHGVFNVLLGSVTAIPVDIFNEPERWLGIQVGGDAELDPLQPIAAVGYAFWAAEADTADYARGAPAAADGDWTISGSDIYSAVSGNVGIGKSSPGAKLDVVGTVNTDTVYQIGGETVLSVEGLDNIFMGVGAGKNDYGSKNTFVGAHAGSTNTSGQYNAFFGAEAGRANTTGEHNTFIGYQAGFSNTEGQYNTFLGDGAGDDNTTGYGNAFLGESAGKYNITGNNNVFIGSEAGIYHTEGGNNVFIGYSAGRFNATGAGNVFLGDFAGYHETGSEKLYIANGVDTSDVLIYGEFDNGRVGLGTLAPVARLDVAGHVSADSTYKIGGETVLSVEGLYNVFVGIGAGKNTNYSDNTFVGAHAGSTNTDGDYNAFFGAGAGRNNTIGPENTFIGNQAGRSNTEGGENTFLGDVAGYSNTTGDYNTFLGQSAGSGNTTGDDNVFIGSEAGCYHTEGDDNTFVGSLAGFSNGTGTSNVFLGYLAGYSETGSEKLYIANNLDTASVLIYGEFDNGKVGLGTLAPEAHLHVESSHKYAGLFESDSSSSLTHVVHAEYTGSSADARAVYGKAVPQDFYGYGGHFEGGYKGVYASVDPTGSNVYYGVHAEVSGGSGTNYGVYSHASGTGTNYAGYFDGLLHANIATASVKAFKIDHPLDPENRYLYHSSVESPDMMNVYNGNVVLDTRGEAWVELPDYFQILNRDFRYQLTCVGGFAPVYIAEKISDNRFKIAGGEPSMEVSWMVTGIRHDPVAQTGRIEAEKMKPSQERGKYLNPEAYGQPESMGVGYVDREKMGRKEIRE